MDDVKQIVSLSGGKDSTAMLHLMLEDGERIDDVVFFDTGWEYPEMYDHLDLIETKTGIKITRLKPKKPFDYWMCKHVPWQTRFLLGRAIQRKTVCSKMLRV